MTHILLAEDSPRIAAFVTKGLRANGYTVTHTADGNEVLPLLETLSVDLLILDIGLPGRDGLDVLRELRGRGDETPVIILTARDSVADTVTGLDTGADDYMAKPFSFDELLARVRRRARGVANMPGTDNTVLTAGRVSLDLRTRRVRVDGREEELTAREFTLLEMFLRHAGQVLAREQLLDQVWGFDYDPGSNVVDVYVRYLRRKLGDDVIQTVRGMGYRLQA
jgi:two-component system copper resistance phosphate regulon response regulator CusR